jgi:AraC-like DNA-binding protein
MIKHIALLTPVYVTFLWSLVFLIHKGEKDKPKIQLGIFMVLACIVYITHLIFFSNKFHLYSFLEGVYIFTMLSVYPMYYFYIILVTTEKISIKNQFLHLLPAIAFGIFSIISTLILTEEQRIFYVQNTLIENNLKGLNWSTGIGIKGHIFLLSRLTLLIQIVVYAFGGINIAIAHNKRVSNYFSDLEGKMLDWVRDISIVIFIVALASIVFAIIGRSYFTRNEAMLLIPSAIFSSILFVIGLKGNQQINITEEIIDNKNTETEFEQNETNNSELKEQIIDLFEGQKIYKNSDLRITTISETLNTNRTYISRFINEEFNMNFSEFVNKYRINEAKFLLEDKNFKLYTMEHIAEISGFGSVNSFNRAFKEIEGVTPGQFKNRRI